MILIETNTLSGKDFSQLVFNILLDTNCVEFDLKFSL